MSAFLTTLVTNENYEYSYAVYPFILQTLVTRLTRPL